MIYKILALVLVLSLCTIPVFADDTQLDLNYLCEEHNCLVPEGVPDAVCANCYFYGSVGFGYSADDLIYSGNEVMTRDVPYSVPYLTRYRGYRKILSPDGNRIDIMTERDYVPAKEITQFNVRGDYYDATNEGFLTISNGPVYEYTPGYKQFWGLSYSPVRESYICTFPYGFTTPRIVLGDVSFDGVTYYDLFSSGVTVNAVVRATSESDASFVPLSSSATYSTNYGVYSSNQKLVNGDSHYNMYSFLSTERYDFAESISIPSQSNGYQNLWVSYNLALDIPAFYEYTGFQLPLQPAPLDDTTIKGAVGSYYSTSTVPRNSTVFSLPLLYDEPVIQLEYKRVLVVDGFFDVANSEYPSDFPNGGVIPGLTYPSGEGSWEDQQFEQGVSPELSGTASSVTDGVDSILDFEADIYNDLNQYKTEIDFGSYSIPDTLAASFGWVSNKFMSFFDSVPDLRPIILFPCYLAIVVAIIHGLENAGARSSAGLIRQSNYDTRSEERSTSARRFRRLMFKRSGK